MSKELERLVLTSVLCQLAARGIKYVPVAVSARHIHLCEEHLHRLFGHSLTKKRELSQPGQYACEETVDFQSQRGKITGIRVLGPTRDKTQLELSVSDCVRVGAAPQIRLSGDLAGTSKGLLIGPAGSVELSGGVIVSKRHLHLSSEQASVYGLKDGDVVGIKVGGLRPGIMEDIVVRTGGGHELDLHIDTDEANAYFLATGDVTELIMPGGSVAEAPADIKPPQRRKTYSLITESDVNDSYAGGHMRMICEARGIVTPAARDRAREVGVEIVKDGLSNAAL